MTGAKSEELKGWVPVLVRSTPGVCSVGTDLPVANLPGRAACGWGGVGSGAAWVGGRSA